MKQVASSIPGSVGYISYPLAHVHRAYDYLGPFGVLWVHMAWHKNCVNKKRHVPEQQWISSTMSWLCFLIDVISRIKQSLCIRVNRAQWLVFHRQMSELLSPIELRLFLLSQLEELAAQKKLRTEMIQMEDGHAQVRREYEMLRMEFEQTLTANEQTGFEWCCNSKKSWRIMS